MRTSLRLGFFAMFLAALGWTVTGCGGGSATTHFGVCGNGLIEEGEECDSGSLGDRSCEYFGFSGGRLGCTDQCTFDFSGCDSRVGSECTTEGQSMCEGPRIISCTGGQWTLVEDCSEEGGTCEVGSDGPRCTEGGGGGGGDECEDECADEGARRCSDATPAVETCSKGPDGCLHWDVTERCEVRCVEGDGGAACVQCEYDDIEDNSRDGSPQGIPAGASWCFHVQEGDTDCLTFDSTSPLFLSFSWERVGTPETDKLRVAIIGLENGRVDSFDVAPGEVVSLNRGDRLFGADPGSYLICLSSTTEAEGIFTYTLHTPRPPREGDLFIDEVYAGSRSSGWGEWVEIMNTTGDYISLEGCVLEGSPGQRPSAMGGGIIPPGARALVANTVAVGELSLTADASYTGTALDISEIRGAYGATMDISLQLRCPDAQGLVTIDTLNGYVGDGVAYQIDSSASPDPTTNDTTAMGCLSVFPFTIQSPQALDPREFLRPKGTPAMPNHSCSSMILYSEDFSSSSIPPDWGGDLADWRIRNGKLHGMVERKDSTIYSPPFVPQGDGIVVVSLDLSTDRQVESTSKFGSTLSTSGELALFDFTDKEDKTWHFRREPTYVSSEGGMLFFYIFSPDNWIGFTSMMDVDNIVVEEIPW